MTASEITPFAPLPEPEVAPTWCPGCGNFGVLAALRSAIESLRLPPHEVVVVSGIGCGSKLPDYLPTYGLLSIHGRPLPIATGIKLANPRLTVIVVDGDGDAYSIGAGHLVHTAHRNPNITHIVQNNQRFGLTGGQSSMTSDAGFKSGASPRGVTRTPMVPTALSFAAGAGLVARGLSNDPNALAMLLARAIEFPGYSHVDVLQPCVSFGTGGPSAADPYVGRTYLASDGDHDYGRSRELVSEWSERIPLGVLHLEKSPRAVATPTGIPGAEGSAHHDPGDPRYRARLQEFRAALRR